MATMNEIDRGAKLYRDAREVLTSHVNALNDDVEKARRTHLPNIKRAVERVRTNESELRRLINDSPEHFDKPKTQVLHGIRVGFKKGAGKLEFDDADQVVKLIRKHFAEQFDLLVKVTERPNKEALSQLTVAELKKLGIEVQSTGDVVFIKDTVSDIDKLVAAMLKQDEEEATA